MQEPRIILASKSPRRKYLLESILRNFGLKFQVIPANIKEFVPKRTKNYHIFVKNLAIKKALEVADKNNGVIIGADTIVVLNGTVLGKPSNSEDACRMLNMLSGREHRVYTGIAVIDSSNNTSYVNYELSKVKFRKLEKDEIEFYVSSGSPMDKAGSYGIQDDFGSTFVKKIEGDYFNVVGLPVMKTYLGLKRILKKRSIIVPKI